jgi:hypothetical protein
MTDTEIAGYMGWRGPGAYTQHQMRRIKMIVHEVQRREQEAKLIIGPFYLKRYDEHSFWIGHESGEGMQVRDHRVLDVLNELWKEF